jgi:lipopolysaccharide biosynthesis protein
MNLQTIKANYNRDRMCLHEIEWLIDMVAQLEEENASMAEKHAEKDIAIRDLMQANLSLMNELELYKLQETKLIAQLKTMKQNSRLTRFYQMAEENLKNAQKLKDAEKEIERLRTGYLW